jgi:energy-coupling factor transporter transmembrane protein EcfT
LVHNRTYKVGKVSKNQPKDKVYPTFGYLILDQPINPKKVKKDLSNRRSRIQTLVQAVWLLMALAILVFSFFPDAVATYFSFGLFQYIGLGLRSLTGDIKMPIGEYVYLILIIILIINSILSLYKLKNKINTESFRTNLFRFGKQLTLKLVQLYVVFMLIWGLNYQKSSPAKSFDLKMDTSYTAVQLDSLSLYLMKELNKTRQILSDSVIEETEVDQVFRNSILNYRLVKNKFPQLHLEKPILKEAAFPSWGDYIGYLAFYQPITGEAIVRTDVPLLTLPYTSCHELAHQMGYASEAEANFIAFVVATESSDALLRYSMLLQMFTYCQSEHLGFIAKTGNFEKWKTIVNRNKAMLDPKVIGDRKKIKDFFIQRQHLLLPASTSLYDQFLQWNKQAKGIKSYDEVLLWVLAYNKSKQ